MANVQVLCQCGWGVLSMPEEDVPNYCPCCGFDFWEHAAQCEDYEDEEE